MNESETDKRAREFSIAFLEAVAFFAVLYVVSRVTGVSVASAGFAVVFLCAGMAFLGLTLLISRARR